MVNSYTAENTVAADIYLANQSKSVITSDMDNGQQAIDVNNKHILFKDFDGGLHTLLDTVSDITQHTVLKAGSNNAVVAGSITDNGTNVSTTSNLIVDGDISTTSSMLIKHINESTTVTDGVISTIMFPAEDPNNLGMKISGTMSYAQTNTGALELEGIVPSAGTAPLPPAIVKRGTTEAGTGSAIANGDEIEAVYNNLTKVASILGNGVYKSNVGFNTSDKIRMHYDSTTGEYGMQIRATNGTGAASVKGKLVQWANSVNSGTQEKFVDIVNSESMPESMPCGVVYEAGIANNSACWIWVNGAVCEILSDEDYTTDHYGRPCIASPITVGQIYVPLSNFKLSECMNVEANEKLYLVHCGTIVKAVSATKVMVQLNMCIGVAVS